MAFQLDSKQIPSASTNSEQMVFWWNLCGICEFRADSVQNPPGKIYHFCWWNAIWNPLGICLESMWTRWGSVKYSWCRCRHPLWALCSSFVTTPIHPASSCSGQRCGWCVGSAVVSSTMGPCYHPASRCSHWWCRVQAWGVGSGFVTKIVAIDTWLHQVMLLLMWPSRVRTSKMHVQMRRTAQRQVKQY